MNFADTNWLEAMFFELTGDKQSRRSIVDRFLRRNPGQLGLSHLVYLEARNVFSRVSGETEPPEWNGERTRPRVRFSAPSRKTWGREIVRSFATGVRAQGAGCEGASSHTRGRVCSPIPEFDQTLKAVAVAEGLEVFPELNEAGKTLLAQLRR